jgi:hypothetical protein
MHATSRFLGSFGRSVSPFRESCACSHGETSHVGGNDGSDESVNGPNQKRSSVEAALAVELDSLRMSPSGRNVAAETNAGLPANLRRKAALS